MSLTRQTATGKNYLTRSDTNADASELVNAIHYYQKFVGSDGVGNILFTMDQSFVAGGHTIWIFLNGQKVEEMESIATGITQYIEVGSTQFQFGAAVLDTDVIEAAIVGGPYDLTPGQIDMTNLPVGMVFPVLNQDTPPTGTLECDGSSISQTTYAELYTGNYLSIGTYYNPTPTVGEFNLPDMRGRVIRHADHGASRDPDDGSRTPDESGGPTGDVVGSTQEDDSEYAQHKHYLINSSPRTENLNASNSLAGFYNPGDEDNFKPNLAGVGTGGDANIGQSSPPIGSSGDGNETRMKNINAMWVIKY